MKRIDYCTMFIASIFIIAMTSCSQDLDYKKACEEKDFVKAYQIVDMLKEDAAQKSADWYGTDPMFSGSEKEEKLALSLNAQEKSEEAERYVILQEAMYVLESQGTNGLMRIVGIGKEHHAEWWLYPELLDVAKKIGDTDLENRIMTIIQPDNSKEVVSVDVEEATPVQPTPKNNNVKKRRRR